MEEEERFARIEQMINDLRQEIGGILPSRETSLAKTKLDECEMWVKWAEKSPLPPAPYIKRIG